MDRLLGQLVVGLVVVISVAAGGCSDQTEDDAERLPPLGQTFDSLSGLSGTVLDHVANGDIDELRELALNEVEFRSVVWPELPSSQPDRGVPFDYAWGDLSQKSSNALRRLVANAGGQQFTLEGIEFTGETTHYDTFLVHRDSLLVVRDEEGVEQRLRFFGSVLERDGEYKIFSFVVD